VFHQIHLTVTLLMDDDGGGGIMDDDAAGFVAMVALSYVISSSFSDRTSPGTGEEGKTAAREVCNTHTYPYIHY